MIRQPSGHATETGTSPQVSVIIPARNAADVLGDCLASVFRSEGVSFEAILVDDASDDDTLRVARSYPCRVIAMRHNIMSANCRNLAARHARGEILVFFDADEMMQRDTLRAFRQSLHEHPDVDAVVGSLAADTPMPGFFSRFKNFRHHFTHQTARVEGTTLDSGRMAIRRSVFEQLGGFEPAFSGASIEDIALGYRMTRLGHRIRFEPGIQMIHLKAYTLGELLRDDVFGRAVPWTALMLRERIARNDLNTSGGNATSVAASWLIPPAVMAGIMGWSPGWWLAAAALGAICWLNRAFLLDGRRRLGGRFALGAAAFLPLMYASHGFGLIAGIVAYLAGRSTARERVAPEPAFELYEPDVN